MKRRVILVITSVVLVVGLLLAGFGCAGEAPPTEGPPTEGPPTEGPPEVKTLKIGMIEALTWPIGVDAMNAVQMDVDKINEDGGLLIGGERYLLDLVVDDNKMDLALAKTAAEKQIFQDKVNFIVGDGWCDSYLDLANDNKIVVVAGPETLDILDPKYHYTFLGMSSQTSFLSSVYWMAERFPDKKTVVEALPDNILGHATAPLWEHAGETAGLTWLESIFYPYPTTDLSAVGTRVKTLNPDFLLPFNGGPDMDSMVIKAAYVAGWKGQVFSTATIPAQYFLGIAGAEPTEGMMALAWPAEFEPAATELAAEFKADWIARYGEWTDPEEVEAAGWWVLKAGLQAASSPDPDEVADILSSGLEFETPMGAGLMVSRPDLDNPRTVHLILESFVKQIEEGEVKQIGTMSPQEIYDICKIIYGW